MNFNIHPNERGLLIAILLLLIVALFGPDVAQPVHQHDFADQRYFGYLPCAGDVLSNLPFALWGIAGLLTLRHFKLDQSTKGLSALFFVGLIITAFASSWYHLQPDNAGLVIDRLA